jgi:hypothetical protein
LLNASTSGGKYHSLFSRQSSFLVISQIITLGFLNWLPTGMRVF